MLIWQDIGVDDTHPALNNDYPFQLQILML